MDRGRAGRRGARACLGAYAEVAGEGTLTAGERLELVSGDPPADALDGTLRALAARFGLEE